MNFLKRLFAKAHTDAAPDDQLADLPGSSLLAIKRRRRETGGELRVNIYRYAQRTFLITSTMGNSGLIVEAGQPSLLPIDATTEQIGRTLCDHLLRHDRYTPSDLPARKLTDWPIFQASGAKSVKAFQAASSVVRVNTINLILELEASPLRTATHGICVRGISHPLHVQLGETVLKTLKAADALQAAGIL